MPVERRTGRHLSCCRPRPEGAARTRGGDSSEDRPALGKSPNTSRDSFLALPGGLYEDPGWPQRGCGRDDRDVPAGQRGPARQESACPQPSAHSACLQEDRRSLGMGPPALTLNLSSWLLRSPRPRLQTRARRNGAVLASSPPDEPESPGWPTGRGGRPSAGRLGCPAPARRPPVRSRPPRTMTRRSQLALSKEILATRRRPNWST